MLSRYSGKVIIALLPLALAGCGSAEGEQPGDGEPRYVLSADEIRLARELAERDMANQEGPSSPGKKTYFIKADLLPDSQADTAQRQVMVHHYRYQGDETILTRVRRGP